MDEEKVILDSAPFLHEDKHELECRETTIAAPQARVAQPQPFRAEAISPHSYLPLSGFVAIFCGILGICTLICSIPAVVLSTSVSIIKMS